jgi:hypothetical protein
MPFRYFLGEGRGGEEKFHTDLTFKPFKGIFVDPPVVLASYTGRAI